MGAQQSRIIERKETVTRFNGRRRSMKHLVQAHRAFSLAHAIYIRSLRTMASALVHFANQLQQQQTMTSSTSDFVQVIKDLHYYFLKAADAATHVSLLLHVPSSAFSTRVKPSKFYSSGPLLSRCSIPKLCEKNYGPGTTVGVNGSHCSIVERLYTWEKKLCQEVKNAERMRMGHKMKVARLRMLEREKSDSVKTDKIKKEVEKLESQITVASQSIETINAEIIKLSETKLYPQLIDLVKGLRNMWIGMYKCHKVQRQIVQKLKDFNTIPSTNPTSEIHRQSTVELEVIIQQWHQSFCNLFKAHRGYIHFLSAWLRLSFSHFSRNSLNKTPEESQIYTLGEQWNLAVNRIPEKVQSKGINSLFTAIHAIVVQQTEEIKQKKKLHAAQRELEKNVVQLQSYSSFESSDTAGTEDRATKKKAKVEHLRAKVAEEKTKHEEAIRLTHAMTQKNLRMSFPQVFEELVEFSSVCVKVFESVYKKANIAVEEHDKKRTLP